MNWIEASTTAAYWVAITLWRQFGKPAVLHPVLTATAIVAVMLLATGMPYQQYMASAWPLNEALGLVIVLLAVPLYRQFALIRQSGVSIAPALLFGSTTALFVALVLPVLAGTEREIVATLAPKSATAAARPVVLQRTARDPARVRHGGSNRSRDGRWRRLGRVDAGTRGRPRPEPSVLSCRSRRQPQVLGGGDDATRPMLHGAGARGGASGHARATSSRTRRG